MIEPLYKRFLVNESLQPLLDLCKHNPNYRGLVIFAYFDHKNDFDKYIRKQNLKIIKTIHHTFEDCYCLDNGSKIFVAVFCDSSCAHRVNGIMYQASIKPYVADTVLNPMLIPYIEKEQK